MNRISVHFFLVTLGFCCLLAGINVGLILLLVEVLHWSAIPIVHLILLYWIVAAWVLTVYIRRQIRKYYEVPARRISEAAGRISDGDFN
ncbi:MAG: hypothetical protein IJV14_18025 [Lachnospiraceae bacterium]|nr:hypothetical protein [Lachnospiraceae bacterium]